MKSSIFIWPALVASMSGCGLILGLQEPTVDDSIEGGSGGDGGDGGNNNDGNPQNNDGSPSNCDGPCPPIVLAKNQGGPFMVAQFGSRVVWTNFIGNTVSAVDKNDGGTSLLAADPLADMPLGLAVDDGGVYFANAGSSGTVFHCAGATCSQSDVIYDAGFTNTDLARNGSFIYFLQADGDELDRIAQTGGAAQKIATTDTNNFDRYLSRIATDGTFVYWSESYNDTILRKPISGGSNQTIFTASSGASPIALLVSGTTLYFAVLGADNGQGTVSSSNLDGTGAQTLAASQHYPYALAIDSNYLYWTTEGDFDSNSKPQGNGGVFRCALSGCGGNPDQLVSNLTDTRGIAVDDTAIYFATFETGSGDGKIWKLIKP